MEDGILSTGVGNSACLIRTDEVLLGDVSGDGFEDEVKPGFAKYFEEHKGSHFVQRNAVGFFGK